MMKKPIKALALMSTGLDSLLAAKLIKDQGIDVHGITFYYRYDNLAKQQASGEISRLLEPLGIPFTAIDISEEFMPILMDPPHGYGSNFNPCIDCHLFMFTKAFGMLEEMGAQFLITGEVVGQRPMSQNSQVLAHMNKVMKFSDLLLRPLSAKLLPETLPERKGWVEREKLLDISGRGRTRQFELVKSLGIEHYHAPGGGCILTVPQFGKRARKLVAVKGKEQVTVSDLELLRLGRHLWIDDRLHVVVGRTSDENDLLMPFRTGRMCFEPQDITGPLVLAQGVTSEADRELVAGITLRYCGRKAIGEHSVSWSDEEAGGVIIARAISAEKCDVWLA